MFRLCRKRVKMNVIEPRILDFTEVASRLKAIGSEIGRFATVIHNGYTSYNSLFYRVTVSAGAEHSWLCIDAHTLAHDWFGIRASLVIGRDSVPCAAWLFSDALRSPLDREQRALCITCNTRCYAGQGCEYDTIEIQQVTLNKLKPAVVNWVKQELPAEARRNRQSR